MAEALTLTAPVQKARHKGKAEQPRAEMLQSLRPVTELKRKPAQEQVGPSPQDLWLRKFSPEETRLIIRGLRTLANTLAAPMHRERDALKDTEDEARKGVSDLQKERLALLLRAIELEESDRDPAIAADLRKLAASKGRVISGLKRARKDARGERIRLMSTQPFGGRILDDLDRTIADWRQRVDPWPRIAELLAEAARAHDTVLYIIANHAVTWAWRGDIPHRWLSFAGYIPNFDPSDDVDDDDQQRWVRTRQHIDIEPPIPAGEVFATLTPASMSLAERGAVEATRRGRRKANEQMWQQWLDQMRDSLSPSDLAAYEVRSKVWRDTGWAGKRAAGDWLVGLVARTGLARPKLHPEFVCVRWPLPGDGPAPKNTLRYLDLRRDVVVLSDDEVLRLDLEEGEAPEPRPAPSPPIFEASFGYVDTETTGMLQDPQAEVVEIGAVILDRWGNEIDRFSELARPWHNPNRPDARAALNISGIKIAELRHARPIAEVAADFQKWLASWRNPVLTAYNVGFDKAMLKRHGVEANWGRCAMHLARRVREGSAKLEDISGDWGLRTEAQEHRALSDVRIGVAVLMETVRRLEVAALTDKKHAAALKRFRASLLRPATPPTPTGSAT